MPLRFFISHVTSEAPVAVAIREWLTASGATAFVASHDIALGSAWLGSLQDSLAAADIVLVLASRRSLERKWVWFEAGSAWAEQGRRCIPVCFQADLRQSDLPAPLSALQTIDLVTDDGIEILLGLVGRKPADVDVPARRAELDRAVAESSRINPWTARTLPKPLGAGVLIDASHGQSDWPLDSDSTTVLARPADVRSAFGVNDRISLESIVRPDQIWRHDLAAWHGLLLAIPNHRRFDADVIDEIVAWVRGGGRLLLLGFELGDRHNESNLNALSERFGIRFNTDIVAPSPTFEGKPYDEPIDVPLEGADHALLRGLASLRLWNVQSVSVEPGGTPLLRLGPLGLMRLTDSIRYNAAGWHRSGKQTFVSVTARPTVASGTEATVKEVIADRYLAAFAPPDLAGRGQVLAIGTWQLRSESSATTEFVKRLIDWLAETGK